MKKLLTVSLVAVMAVSAAHADIASTTYVTDRTGSNTYAGKYTTGSTNLTAAVEALDAAIKGVADVSGTVDTTVIQGSANPVSGGAVYSELADKQDNLSQAQLDAVNSGITSEKVTAYDAYATGKQDALDATQMKAVNSGITAEKVATFEGKQNALDETQMKAVNSGITSEKVTAYDAYATSKQDALPAGSLAFVPKECADTLCALTIDTAGNAVWTPVQ